MNSPPRFAADIMSRELVTLEETQDLRFLPEVMKLFRFRHMLRWSTGIVSSAC